MIEHKGPVYLRVGRPEVPKIYSGGSVPFQIGKANQLRDGKDMTLIACGLMVAEALKAAETLAAEGVEARVIDLYSIKPIDADTLRSIASPIVTVEDHWIEGGLGEAVLTALSESTARPPVVQLAVHEMPHSGKPAELLAEAGIDAAGIAAAARKLVGSHVG